MLGLTADTANNKLGRIRVTFPPLKEVLAEQFSNLAVNLAYLVHFEEQSPALQPQANGFSIELPSGEVISIATAQPHKFMSDLPFMHRAQSSQTLLEI